ncbi:MAG: NAD(P)/FAD-dependent oxidoreductase [Chloroflexi bacterium]|nr:NAD(P)/FAD-dependent oxidoreductase [Chloroflexota bacterium]MBI3340669.1 NAD(P)/FAD-dependent oxidoreductase [Chloroflexota bacterium]
MTIPDRPRVVIIGAGFAGLWAARALSHSQTDVLVLNRNNYHTFFPLLYQVAAGELEAEDIVYPVRSILRGQENIRFLMNEVTEIDLAAKQVKTTDHVFPYDFLVLALGSASHFFGVTGAAEYAFQLKTLEQAIALRNHILFRFERALCETDPERRRQMLTFAIVGGGPTGVEFAGALAELIRGPLVKNYQALDPREMHILLLEANDRLLASFPERLEKYALRRLAKMGVEVRLQATVSQITPDCIRLKDGATIPLETVIWTSGVRGESFNAELQTIRNGQVKVLPTLQTPDHPEVYVIGDLAFMEEDGRPLPMLAPVATQQGEAAARNIIRQTNGQIPVPFHYHNRGTMVTIGRNAAIAHVWGRAFAGFPAWLLWLSIHLYGLIGFRNRLLVLIKWAWDYLFFERAVSLVVSLPVSQTHSK